MSTLAPAVVIDNGSSTTRAGFALEELPSLVFSSNYVVNQKGKVVVGDAEIAKNPSSEVMTLVEDGVVYNTNNIVHNWQYAYDNLDGGNGVVSSDHPLMITEPVWNNSKTKTDLAQIAFEQLQVPLFSIVKSPLAQLYYMGRSSGLVVEVGASVASVTPILDGIVQQKSSFHTKYAGDFLSLHTLRSLEAKMGYQPLQLDYTRLLPRKFGVCELSDSFKLYYINQNVLLHFKQTMLYVNEPQQGASGSYYSLHIQHQHPSLYQLPDSSHVTYGDPDLILLTEPLFVPHLYKLPGIKILEPSVEKAETHGVSNLILFALKNLEASFMSSVTNESQSTTANSRFNDILRLLFGNFLFSGGCSMVPGFSERLCGELTRLAPLVLPNYLVTGSYKLSINVLRNAGAGEMSEILDRKFASWLGAANLSNTLKDSPTEDAGLGNIALDNWFVSKANYEELGQDYIVERFK
ncbi:actin-domain-containing protein [Metschnikowia bicuspidata]|uniref:Actin-domain-containing protein n=1 Tax=Metschnikowia bicuspidata TaxID=27322 RepID=A0A4P9ZGU1_9ASCO|nr:actin-domain-containing protein [Metschnikowia bicuspidata]